jgi:MFS family permease
MNYLGFFDAVKEMGSVIIFTPFMGLIFIFFLAGMLISIKNIKKFSYSFWLFYFIGILFFYNQGEFVPERQTIFMPAIATFAAIGLIVPYQHFKDHKKTYLLPILLAFSFSYSFFMFFMFSRLFPSEFTMVSTLISMYGLSGLLNFLIVYWPVFILILFIFFIFLFQLSRIRCYFNKIHSIYVILVAVLLIVNLAFPFVLVHGGIGIYKRTGSTSIVGEYMRQNLGNEKYSCVAGIESKSFAFYTQRPCAFWVNVNVSWLEEQSSKRQLKYFIVNTHYPNKSTGLGNVLPDGTLGPEIDNTSDWTRNHVDKYDWLQQNTVDITKKVGLKNSNEYKVYVLKENV